MAEAVAEDRVSSSDEELDEIDAPLSEKDKTRTDITQEKSINKLDYFISNGLRQVFEQLDVKSKGSLAKTQLQVICANICNVLKLNYSAEELVGYQKEKVELTFAEFLSYINDELLPKGRPLIDHFGDYDHYGFSKPDGAS